MTRVLPRGRVIADIAGLGLEPAERALLEHPQVGGVILFARNYASPAQLTALTAEIRAIRSPSLLIAVDHEGGRVQRFREGFTAIPPMRALGRLWDGDQDRALVAARQCGLVLASELRARGVDLSFTPVLDLDHGPSGVIGDRALHRDPEAVAALAAALQRGLAEGGMAACGKHFPGHGHVAADSHVDIPVDERSLSEIEADDLIPFRRLIAAGLAAVMPAHVIYPKVDSRPAGFSPVWLSYLRGACRFEGLVFSDDLSMEAASAAGGVVQRGLAAIEAGCDMVLLCNDPRSARELIDGFERAGVDGPPAARIGAVLGPPRDASAEEMLRSERYLSARAAVAAIA